MNIVELGRPAWRALFKMTATPATYQPHAGAALGVLAFIRGVRADDLFAGAMQQDMMAMLDATEFAQRFPARPIPARYDRLRTATMSYAVEEWRGSTAGDAPVFFKLLLRGGQQ
jgi:hypothetical protein